LFIVPCDAAHTGGQRLSQGAGHTSAARWLTSTLPAPTATGSVALTIVPGGAITVTGRSAPPLLGMVGSSTDRKANATADGHRFDRVDVAVPLRRGAREVELDVGALDGDRDHDPARQLLRHSGPERIDDVLSATGRRTWRRARNIPRSPYATTSCNGSPAS
jgi:hypothetical protein